MRECGFDECKGRRRGNVVGRYQAQLAYTLMTGNHYDTVRLLVNAANGRGWCPHGACASWRAATPASPLMEIVGFAEREPALPRHF